MATMNQVGVGLSGSTGTGTFVGANTPTLISPLLGTPTSGVLTNCTGYPASAVSGQVLLANGGTSANLTASNGGIFYSTATAAAILSGTATANLPLLSGSTAAPTWGAFALSLGGALTTAGTHILSGAFSSTFTFTNTTTVTFPTSGTLATTTQIPTGAALTKTDDTNVTATLGGSPTTALVNAASITLGWTGQLGLTRGGTAASLTASNGGIIYSTASAMAVLSGTATANQILMSGSSAAPIWSTSAYPTTLGTGIATWLTTPSSANLLSAMTDKTGTGLNVFGTAPTLKNPVITDANSLNVLTFGVVASAVNYFNMVNRGTGLSPYLESVGSDTNIGMLITMKGTGICQIASAALAIPLQLLSGTTQQHTTNFSFANTSAFRTVTFPDTDFTVAQLVVTKANGTEASNLVTASGNAGVITTSSLSTAGGGSYAITWTNTSITATSAVFLTISGGTNTTQNINFKCVPGSGSATLTIYNLTVATALNGTILISYYVC